MLRQGLKAIASRLGLQWIYPDTNPDGMPPTLGGDAADMLNGNFRKVEADLDTRATIMQMEKVQENLDEHVEDKTPHIISISYMQEDSATTPGVYKITHPSTHRPYMPVGLMFVSLTNVSDSYRVHQFQYSTDMSRINYRYGDTTDLSKAPANWTEWTDVTPTKGTDFETYKEYVEKVFLKNGENSDINLSSDIDFYLNVARDIYISSREFMSIKGGQMYLESKERFSASGRDAEIVAQENIYLDAYRDIRMYAKNLTFNDTRIPTVNDVILNGNNYNAVDIDCIFSTSIAFPIRFAASLIEFTTRQEDGFKWNGQQVVVVTDLEAYQKLLKPGVNIITINDETILQGKNLQLATQKDFDGLEKTVTGHGTSITTLQTDVETAQGTADHAHERIDNLATVNGQHLQDGGNIEISVSRSLFEFGDMEVPISADGVIQLPDDLESLVSVFCTGLKLAQSYFKHDKEKNTVTIISENIKINPGKDRYEIWYNKKNSSLPRTTSIDLMCDEGGNIQLPDRTIDAVQHVFWNGLRLAKGSYTFMHSTNTVIITDDSIDFTPASEEEPCVFSVDYTY